MQMNRENETHYNQPSINDVERKYLPFNPEQVTNEICDGWISVNTNAFATVQVQCLCEALQQKGDVDKLASFLWNLPSNEMYRSNESVLR